MLNQLQIFIFRFFNDKNCNARVAAIVKSMLIAKTFLFKIFWAIFAFLIVKIIIYD